MSDGVTHRPFADFDRLHRNLIEHINSEIGLGSIKDLASAIQWLSGTFFHVRFKANPNHYKLDRDGKSYDSVKQICSDAIELLSDNDLVEGEVHLRQTAFGSAMARYCISFETMKSLVVPTPKPRISEMVCLVP